MNSLAYYRLMNRPRLGADDCKLGKFATGLTAIGCAPVKSWTFTACAIGAFVASALSLAVLVINAVTGSEFLQFLLPVAIAALAGGGALSARAHILWLKKG